LHGAAAGSFVFATVFLLLGPTKPHRMHFSVGNYKIK
jgi:hypothetical protein